MVRRCITTLTAGEPERKSRILLYPSAAKPAKIMAILGSAPQGSALLSLIAMGQESDSGSG